MVVDVEAAGLLSFFFVVLEVGTVPRPEPFPLEAITGVAKESTLTPHRSTKNREEKRMGAFYFANCTYSGRINARAGRCQRFRAEHRSLRPMLHWHATLLSWGTASYRCHEQQFSTLPTW